MDETEIIKFDKTEAQLKEIVAETAGIVEVNIENKEEIEKVKKARIYLGKIRVDLQKFGKSKRDWFNEMAKKIITKEKELIAIIEPEEERLYAFEEELKKKKEIADRLAVLPHRKEKLQEIGIVELPSDEFICSFDSAEFVGYCNKLVAEKNERDRKLIEQREAELNKAENEAKRKEEIRIAEEKARQEEREKAEQREKDRIERERIEGDRERARIAKEKEDQELREKAEKEKLESDKKYKSFLSKNKYNEETDIIQKDGEVVKLYRLINQVTL